MATTKLTWLERLDRHSWTRFLVRPLQRVRQWFHRRSTGIDSGSSLHAVQAQPNGLSSEGVYLPSPTFDQLAELSESPQSTKDAVHPDPASQSEIVPNATVPSMADAGRTVARIQTLASNAQNPGRPLEQPIVPHAPPLIDFARLMELQMVALAYLRSDLQAFQVWREEGGFAPLLLVRADLTQCHLASVNWRNTTLVGVDFTGSNLAGANFQSAVVRSCTFTDANLTGVSLEGSDVSEWIDISPEVLGENAAVLKGGTWNLPRVSFKVRLQGKAKLKGDLIKQRVEIKNDSPHFLSFFMGFGAEEPDGHHHVQTIAPRSTLSISVEGEYRKESTDPSLCLQIYLGKQRTGSPIETRLLPLWVRRSKGG